MSDNLTEWLRQLRERAAQQAAQTARSAAPTMNAGAGAPPPVQAAASARSSGTPTPLEEMFGLPAGSFGAQGGRPAPAESMEDEEDEDGAPYGAPPPPPRYAAMPDMVVAEQANAARLRQARAEREAAERAAAERAHAETLERNAAIAKARADTQRRAAQAAAQATARRSPTSARGASRPAGGSSAQSTLALSDNLFRDLRTNPAALREAVLLLEALGPCLADRDPAQRFF